MTLVRGNNEKSTKIAWCLVLFQVFIASCTATPVSTSSMSGRLVSTNVPPTATTATSADGCRQPWMPADAPSICPWKSGLRLPEPRTYHASVLVGDRVYVAGGFALKDNSVEYFSGVLSADLGSLKTGQGEWRAENPITDGRSGLGMATADTCVIVAGGTSYDSNGPKYFSDVETAIVGTEGVLSKWRRSSSAMQVPRSNHTLLVGTVGGRSYVYAVGGVTDIGGDTVHLDSVEYAPIDSACRVGEWKLGHFHIHGGRSSPQALIISGHIAVFGGWGDLDLEDVFRDVQTSAIGSAGAPAPWRTVAAALPTGMYGHASLATDVSSGHLLLLVGGQAGTGAYSNWVSFAYSDTALQRVGVFRIAPNGHLPSPRSGSTAHLHGNDLFVIGGSGPQGAYFDDVLVSSLDSGTQPN